MVAKKTAKILFVGVILLLVFTAGCGSKVQSGSAGDKNAVSSGAQVTQTQKQAIVKAKKSTNSDLDQLNKGLDDLQKADVDAENLNPDQF